MAVIHESYDFGARDIVTYIIYLITSQVNTINSIYNPFIQLHLSLPPALSSQCLTYKLNFKSHNQVALHIMLTCQV